MKLKAKSMMIMSLAFVVSSCSGGMKTFTIPQNDVNDAYGLSNRLARDEYRGLLGSSIGSLNYVKTAQSADAQHFANFVDGLLTHNQYGALIKNLASKVEHNDDYTEFTFTVRKNIPWQRYDGSQYVATVNGKKVPQYVVASDWLTTAKAVLKYDNESDMAYLVHSFVRGAAEYYVYTEILYLVSVGKLNIDPANLQRVAREVNSRIKTEFPAIWQLEYNSEDNPVSANDIPSIADGARLGIVVNDDAGTIKYILNQKASYFPTLFTYSAYLPINQYFLKEVKFSSFGTTKDKILYNGPYLLKNMDTKNVQYVANRASTNKSKIGYWNEANTLTIGKVSYKVLSGSPQQDYTRKEFEADRIDGFSLNYKDKQGWTKYVTGQDGSGTYENPVRPEVNSRLLDTIGNCYGGNLVLDRESCGNNTSYYSGGSTTTVNNTSRALSINEVRKAIMKGLDNNQYFYYYNESLAEELRSQTKIYTYVPKGFAVDSEGNDYIAKYYYEEYAEQKGINVGDPENPEPGTAAYLLRPGQTESLTLSQTEVDELVLDAVKAVKLYNEQYSEKSITFPINIEYFCVYSEDQDKEIANLVVNGDPENPDYNGLNARLNHSSEAKTLAGADNIFNVVLTDKVTTDNYEQVSGSSGGQAQFDFAPIQWGWGADYGDPLTYMNTFVKGGDWGSVFPFVKKTGDQVVNNYFMNETKTALEQTDLLAHYTELVADGANETENFTARFEKFAKAEYELLENLNFYLPQTNNGQGWSLSVSRSAGYFVPTANYGIANDRFVGLYVLNSVMSREDRQRARAQQDADKEEFFKHYDAINGIYDD